MDQSINLHVFIVCVPLPLCVCVSRTGKAVRETTVNVLISASLGSVR